MLRRTLLKSLVTIPFILGALKSSKKEKLAGDPGFVEGIKNRFSSPVFHIDQILAGNCTLIVESEDPSVLTSFVKSYDGEWGDDSLFDIFWSHAKHETAGRAHEKTLGPHMEDILGGNRRNYFAKIFGSGPRRCWLSLPGEVYDVGKKPCEEYQITKGPVVGLGFDPEASLFFLSLYFFEGASGFKKNAKDDVREFVRKTKKRFGRNCILRFSQYCSVEESNRVSPSLRLSEFAKQLR